MPQEATALGTPRHPKTPGCCFSRTAGFKRGLANHSVGVVVLWFFWGAGKPPPGAPAIGGCGGRQTPLRRKGGLWGRQPYETPKTTLHNPTREENTKRTDSLHDKRCVKVVTW